MQTQQTRSERSAAPTLPKFREEYRELDPYADDGEPSEGETEPSAKWAKARLIALETLICAVFGLAIGLGFYAIAGTY